MKIVLAVDGSSCSDVAVQEVARRPWPEGSELHILSAMEPAPAIPLVESAAPPKDYYEQLDQAARRRAEDAVQRAAETLRRAGTGLTVTTVTPEGVPKEVIVGEAERWGADLIVVGSHGYGGWKRFWLGSVSHAVAFQARCSVEIVRSADDGCESSD